MALCRVDRDGRAMESQRIRAGTSTVGRGRGCRHKHSGPLFMSIGSVMNHSTFLPDPMVPGTSFSRTQDSSARESVIPIVENGEIEM